MRKMRERRNIIQILFIICFALAISMNFINITAMKDAARAINYSGIIRGKSQRIIKLELAGKENDQMILDIDCIMEGLRYGGTSYNLVKLKDKKFQENMDVLAEKWTDIKKNISSYRKDNSEENYDVLLTNSEELFLQANETVYAAEKYADRLSKTMTMLQIIAMMEFAIYALIAFTQIASERTKAKKAKKQAETDMLTGLLNKIGFEEKMRHALHVLSKKGQEGLFIILDIDEFKQINDVYGHAVGDDAIRFLAGKLQDVLKKEAIIGRFGGDEFVAFLKDAANMEQVKSSLEILNMELKEHAEGETVNVPFFTCSFGMTIAKKDEEFEQIFSRGDEALYEAKESGRARVCVKS